MGNLNKKRTCPKCGKEQDPANVCVKCGTIFSKYSPGETILPDAAQRLQPEAKSVSHAAPEKQRVSVVNILGLLLIINSTLSLSRRIAELSLMLNSDTSTFSLNGKYVYETAISILLLLSALGLLLREKWGRILVLFLMMLSLGKGLFLSFSYYTARRSMDPGSEIYSLINSSLYPILVGSAFYALFIALLFTKKVKAEFDHKFDHKQCTFIRPLWQAIVKLFRIITLSGWENRETAGYKKIIIVMTKTAFLLCIIIAGFFLFREDSLDKRNQAHPSKAVLTVGDSARSGALPEVPGTIAAEEPVMRRGFYDAYSYSPQVIRSIWLDLDKAGYMDDGGMYTMYLKLSHLVSYKKLGEWAAMPIFKEGPHLGDLLNVSSRTDFGHYNKEFVVWMRNNLIPAANDEAFRILTQHLFDTYLSGFARAYYRAYCDMKANQPTVEMIKNAYREAITSGEYYYFEESRNTLTLRYPQSTTDIGRMSYANTAFTFSRGIDKKILFFWIRRSMDGTDSEFALGLEKLLQTYDREFLRNAKTTTS